MGWLGDLLLFSALPPAPRCSLRSPSLSLGFLSHAEVSLVAVLWLGAELAGKSPTSCGWTESLSLWITLWQRQGRPLGKAKGV